ncbi:uncharacterized protein LOC104881797 isoform X1 [Vitis vinifera]|uniref:uncharacterized protein LOC104881797 isoform X1 n=2 Tax=Vitis vinifera TaxID=29760 RepID=UPI00053FC86D|nr:uncharacterized protein LOC104881797 isoform X1 [Vitis vinifera]XP_059599160.1 uncharacterized protein LOC104881797 isoform X1 [Vitis vinifera]XP_059599161.1 uncharacterized protein LOC104881797 isoform X1 [Vitis vinifera]|eukprot:XP_010661333.1 PREDICTED: uncharacterized protein LOC104881797 isoform X1 [Vitis vinifera]
MKKPFSEVALQTRESLERPYFPLPLDPRRLKNTTTSSLFHCKLHFSPYLAGADHLRAVEIEMGITQDLLKAVDQYRLECFEKAQLHGQTTGSTQLHGQTTVCSHY